MILQNFYKRTKSYYSSLKVNTTCGTLPPSIRTYVLCSTNLGIFETCILYHCSLKSKSCEMKCPCPIPPNFKHLHARAFRFCCCLLDISFHKIGLLETVIYVVNIPFSAILHQHNNIWKLFIKVIIFVVMCFEKRLEIPTTGIKINSRMWPKWRGGRRSRHWKN